MELEHGDVVDTGTDHYYIQSVVDTGLVRLRFKEDTGKAAFQEVVSNSNFVTVHRSNCTVREVSQEDFQQAINRFVTKKPALGAFMTLPVEADDYYLAADCNAGYAIDGDELVGLFNDTGESGVGKSLIIDSIAKGATRLFCYDTDLVDIYKQFGFEEYDRAPWDDSLASEDWDYEQFGEPDVVWMKID